MSVGNVEEPTISGHFRTRIIETHHPGDRVFPHLRRLILTIPRAALATFLQTTRQQSAAKTRYSFSSGGGTNFAAVVFDSAELDSVDVDSFEDR